RCRLRSRDIASERQALAARILLRNLPRQQLHVQGKSAFAEQRPAQSMAPRITRDPGLAGCCFGPRALARIGAIGCDSGDAGHVSTDKGVVDVSITILPFISMTRPA